MKNSPRNRLRKILIILDSYISAQINQILKEDFSFSSAENGLFWLVFEWWKMRKFKCNFFVNFEYYEPHHVRPLCKRGANVKSGEKCFKGTYESTKD